MQVEALEVLAAVLEGVMVVGVAEEIEAQLDNLNKE